MEHINFTTYGVTVYTRLMAQSKLRAIGTDILGVLMLIGSAMFGWLPGPGGLPLLIGGLSLLSINHEWARKLLHKVKQKGTSLYDIFFPNKAWVHWAYDIIGIVIASVAIYAITLETKNIVTTFAISAVFVSVGLLVSNRRRLEKISSLVTKKRRTKP